MANGQGREDALVEPRALRARPGAAETKHINAATRIRHLEDHLRRHEERYRALALATGQMMWSMDASGLVVDPSPGWCAFVGQSPDEAKGTGWLAAVHPDDRARLEAEWQAARAAKRVWEYHFRARRSDGRYRWLLARGVPVCDDSGDVREWIGACTDITERELAEQRTLAAVDAVLALAGAAIAPEELAPLPSPATPEVATAAREPSSTSVIKHIAALTVQAMGGKRVAVATVDPETEIMRPVALVGFAPDEEAHWWAGWSPNVTVSDRMGAGVAQRLRAGEVVQIDMSERSARERLGRYHVRTLFVVPMRVRGRLVGALAIDDAGVEHTFTERDRTLAGAVGKLAALVVERDRLLREREEAGARALALEEANRRMDGFLSVAAHELKTPLTSMKVNLQITQRRLRLLAEEAQRAGADMQGSLAQAFDLVTRLTAGLRRQERLSDDLLDVSRIQSGKLEMRPERVDLSGIVRQVVEEQCAGYPNREISLEATGHPIRVDADPDRIAQVVTNLLTNALKYAPPTLPVAVRLTLDGRSARVLVRDQGPGIPPDHLIHVWERFYRVPGISHRSGSAVGLGLGLYICREIVERHGGAVGAESAPGAGSTFWFELPLPPEPA